MTDIIETRYTVEAADCDLKPSALLAEKTGLSQAQIKDAMAKGAVWLQRQGKRARLRRASKVLKSGDIVEMFYNAAILQQQAVVPQLISDEGEYSLWFKPYGLSCQGSRWGDFCSINRQVEAHFSFARPVFLVHRLDNATSGILLLAHNKAGARSFSTLFEQRNIDKRYCAIVPGDLSHMNEWTEIDADVDGKRASTLLQCRETNEQYSLLDIRLNTGRKHQIRQHLAGIGHSIVGDRLYGDAVEGDVDLQLQAQSLSFFCPITGEDKAYGIDEALRLKLENIA